MLAAYLAISLVVFTAQAAKPAFLQDSQVNQEELSVTGNYPCVFLIGTSWYDLTPLKIGNNGPYNATYSLDPTVTYEFQFCQVMSDVTYAACSGDYYASQTNLTDSCIAMSGSDPTSDINAEVINYYNVTDDTNSTALQLKYTQGAACPATNEPMTFTINVVCDPNVQVYWDFFAGLLATGSECDPVVTMKSQYGCEALSISALWDMIYQYEYLFGVFAIAGGFFLSLFGLRLVKPTMFIIGILTTVAAVGLLFYSTFLSQDTEEWVFWVVLAAAIIGGIIVGYLLARFIKVGASILAGWGGFTCGLLLNEAVLYKAEMEWLFWVSCILLAIIAVALAFKFFEPAIIVSTAIVGSYLLIRGISFYAGHYYNEFQIAQLAKEGLIDQIDPWFWAYVGGFFVWGLLSLCIQFKALKKQRLAEQEKEHPYEAIQQKK